MEYGFTQKLFGYFYHSSCMKQAAKQKLNINKKAIKQEYVSIMKNAKDIGKSRLMSSYCMGAYFIALNRKTHCHRKPAMNCTRTAYLPTSCFI